MAKYGADTSAVLNGVAKGDFHQPGGLKCECLFGLDEAFFDALRSDIRSLVVNNTPSDVNRDDHVTNWTKPYGQAIQFSLLNRSGDFADTSSDHTLTIHGKRFHHETDYPVLAEFISLFPHALNMRLNGMSPQGGLSPHEEHVGWRQGRRYFYRGRFHLPIETNPEAVVLLDGDFFHLEPGSLYFFNNGCIHSAANRGNSQRFHLVWDMLLTQETIDLMFGTDSPWPLKRLPKDLQRVPIVESAPIGAYEISGAGEKIYRLLRLSAFGIKPYRWQNQFNMARYRAFRAIGHAAPVSVR
jgi:Aspartyl/Asparaginyl beta-hydroxylase